MRAVDSITHCKKQCNYNWSLWSNLVLRKRYVLTQILKDFRPEAFYLASESKQSATKVFFFHYSLATSKDQLGPHFHRFIISCTWWDTPSENTDLWQITKGVFNNRSIWNASRCTAKNGKGQDNVRALWETVETSAPSHQWVPQMIDFWCLWISSAHDCHLAFCIKDLSASSKLRLQLIEKFNFYLIIRWF